MNIILQEVLFLIDIEEAWWVESVAFGNQKQEFKHDWVQTLILYLVIDRLHESPYPFQSLVITEVAVFN